MLDNKPPENKKLKSLSGEDWDIIYEHGGKEIDEIRNLFTEILEKRARLGVESSLGDTIGELLCTVPEDSRNKIYRLFGKAILNCKKKGYLSDINLK